MKSFSSWLLLASLIGALGCSSDGGGGDQGPAGRYTATELTLSIDGDNTDLLAQGASFTMVLSSAGATSGTLVAPGAYTESGTEESFSLAGTYEYTR